MAKRENQTTYPKSRTNKDSYLACLFNREVGANAYTIEHKSNIPGQEYGRLREFLEEMCKTLETKRG